MSAPSDKDAEIARGLLHAAGCVIVAIFVSVAIAALAVKLFLWIMS